MQKQGVPMEHNRMMGLDGLRALAIIGVILFHLYPYDVVGGYVGVCLFFVLSGFLIGYRSFLDMSNLNFSVLRFYKKRILRIYPGLFFMVFGTCGAMYLCSPEVLRGKATEIGSIFLGINNWWQIIRDSSYFARISGQTPFLHIWSLAVEVQFYLFYPLFFYLFLWFVRRVKRRGALLILMLLTLFAAVYLANGYMAGMETGRLYYGTDTRVFSFLLGVCGGYFCISNRRDGELHFKWFYVLLFILGIAVSVIACGWLDGESTWTYIIGLQGMSAVFLMLILIASDARLPIGKWLDVKPLRWLGSRSYELYLWHYPVVFYLHYRKWMQRPCFIIAGMALSLILAEWTYRGSQILLQRKFPKLLGKIVFFILSVGMILLMGVGIVGVARKGWQPLTDQERLQKELEDSRRTMEERQKLQDANRQAMELANAARSGYIDGETVVDMDSVTIIGDSVLLSASEELNELMPNAVIDAQESRQMKDAIDIVTQMKENGTLGSTVVIALGTNGFFWESDGQALIDAIGSDRNIFWVNVYGEHLEWQYRTNGTIRTLVRKNDNVHMISWVKRIRGNLDWLYEDGIHVDKVGQQAYAQMVYDALDAYKKQE